MRDTEMDYRVVSYFQSETDDNPSACALFLRIQGQVRAYALEHWAEVVGCENEYSIEWLDSILTPPNSETSEGMEEIESLFIAMEYLDAGPLRTTASGSVLASALNLSAFSQKNFMTGCDKEELDLLLADIQSYEGMLNEGDAF